MLLSECEYDRHSSFDGASRHAKSPSLPVVLWQCMSGRAFSFPLSVKEKCAQGQFSVPRDLHWQHGKSKQWISHGSIDCNQNVQYYSSFVLWLLCPENESRTVDSLPRSAKLHQDNKFRIRHQCVDLTSSWGKRWKRESINHRAAALTRHLTISWADFSGQSHNALLRQPEHELCILLK